jgi:hypothetical protein
LKFARVYTKVLNLNQLPHESTGIHALVIFPAATAAVTELLTQPRALPGLGITGTPPTAIYGHKKSLDIQAIPRPSENA